jgi:hypothetical protein
MVPGKVVKEYHSERISWHLLCCVLKETTMAEQHRYNENPMNNLRDDEPTILTRLMPNLQRLQNDSRGLMQWIVTLNDRERLALMHWARQRAPWLISAIQRVPPSTSYAPKTAERAREVSA